MDMEQEHESLPVIYNQESISFPLDKDAFKEFITSLLGQPDLVEGFVEGPFEIGMGDFEHLNHSIDSRIENQNKSSRLGFQAKLFLITNLQYCLIAFKNLSIIKNRDH